MCSATHCDTINRKEYRDSDECEDDDFIELDREKSDLENMIEKLEKYKKDKENDSGGGRAKGPGSKQRASFPFDWPLSFCGPYGLLSSSADGLTPEQIDQRIKEARAHIEALVMKEIVMCAQQRSEVCS